MTRLIGSWQGIAAVVAFCAAWLLLGLPEERLTLALSILALSFSQLILIDTNALTEREQRKLDAIIHGTDADDGQADDTP